MIATSATIVTGLSPGAIGVVRVVGPEALTAVAGGFKPVRGGNLRSSRSSVPRFGRMGRGEGDEVVVLIIRNTEVEIHAHGGPAALGSVLDDLRAQGVAIGSRVAGSEHDRLTARAATLRVADIFMDQSGGAFEREKARLTTLSPADRMSAVDSLRQLAKFGLHLDRGWSVVLAGRPNVGKSSLLNAIAGFDRAIVSPVAGTTRDVVTARVAIDGWPVELSDTAGVRTLAQGVEASGIALANEARDRSDLVVLVLDRSSELTRSDREMIESCPGALLVANKSDLPAAWLNEEVAAQPVSAATGEGLAGLLAMISARIVPTPPAPGTVVPILAEDVAWLESFASDRSATS